MHILTLPRIFYDDHVERDCLPGEVVKMGIRLVTIRCDDKTLEDLYSDAKHYASLTAGEGSDYDMEPEYRGLIRSAKATLKRIENYKKGVTK